MGQLMLSVWTDVPDWGADADLILRNARADSVQFVVPDSFNRADGTPLAVDPVGLSYDRLGGAGTSDGFDLGELNGRYIDSLLASPLIAVPGKAGFIPQPYMQLESVLRGIGADRAANRVALARHGARMDWLWRDGQYARWAAEGAWLALTGFGHRPFRVLIPFAALVLLGAVLARHAHLAGLSGHRYRLRWTHAFWFSLENALPLIEPAADHAQLRFRNAWVDSYFHFQKIMGFVLATVLVGALTVLGG